MSQSTVNISRIHHHAQSNLIQFAVNFINIGWSYSQKENEWKHHLYELHREGSRQWDRIGPSSTCCNSCILHRRLVESHVLFRFTSRNCFFFLLELQILDVRPISKALFLQLKTYLKPYMTCVVRVLEYPVQSRDRVVMNLSYTKENRNRLRC